MSTPTPTFCDECDPNSENPFKGTHGLEIHRRRVHNGNKQRKPVKRIPSPTIRMSAARFAELETVAVSRRGNPIVIVGGKAHEVTSVEINTKML